MPGAGGYVRADHGHITPETDPWLGRPIRWAGGTVKSTAVTGVRFAGTTLWLPADCAREFTAAFWDRVRERALALAVDPRELIRLIREIGRSPEAFLPDVPNPIDGVRYVREVFSMGLRDGALRASRDSGRAAADVAIELATRGAARAVRRAMRRPAPTAPSPKASRPAGPAWRWGDVGAGRAGGDAVRGAAARAPPPPRGPDAFDDDTGGTRWDTRWPPGCTPRR